MVRRLLLGRARNAHCQRPFGTLLCADDGPRGWDPPVACIPELECEDPRQDFPRCKRKVPAAGRCRPGTGPPPNTTSACIVWSTISPELAAKVGARARQIVLGPTCGGGRAPSRDPAVVFARATSEEGRGFVKRVRVPAPSKYAHVSQFHPRARARRTPSTGARATS
ncbi:pyrophosphatase [Aureococcus anophagefferens]|nr:pyrophosphatase [Aureococcus anophagefferens]